MQTKSNPSFRTWAGRSVLLRSLTVALCGMAFTACNRQETMMLNEENGEASVLKIGANVAQPTKATDAGFEIKDTLGLYAVKWLDASTPDTLRPTANHADNVWFRLESNVENWKPEHTIYFPADNNKIDLYAYYPYRKPAFGNGTQINLNVATNQTDSADYTRSDFMAAKTPNVKRTPNKVLLSFEHKLSQITIELKPGTGFSFADLKNAEVTIVNAITDATYDLAKMNTTPTVEDPEHRTVPVAGTTRADVTPHGIWYQKGDTTLAGKMAILVPQTLGANTYIQVTLGSRKFNFKPDNINLNSGCSRRFTLTLSNTGLDITTVIIPWKNCGAVAGEAEEEFELDTIVTMTTTKQFVIFTIEKNSDIEVDWGDGVIQKNRFLHIYPDSSEHTITFYGKNTALTYLGCGENQLTSLDVCKNIALKYLSCPNNLLTSLDVRKNETLSGLSCEKNLLKSIDISQNKALFGLSCSNNPLDTLNISKNLALTHLMCSNCQLTDLYVNKHTLLTDLECAYNRLTKIDISNNINLTNLVCNSNRLDHLDVSQNINLKILLCNTNPFITNTVTLTSFANSLPNRTGKESGTLQITDSTAAAQIKSITDAKNWEIK